MAYERNQTILELFARTIQREYNHLVSMAELIPLEEGVDQVRGERFIKILKGDSISILRVLLEYGDEQQRKENGEPGELLKAYHASQALKNQQEAIDQQFSACAEDEDGLTLEERSKLRKLLRQINGKDIDIFKNINLDNN